MNIVRFHYHDSPHEIWAKDFEFSAQSMNERYQEGLKNAEAALLNPKWLKPVPCHQVVIIHEY